MKYSPHHLPEPHRRDLSHIADILVKQGLAYHAVQNGDAPYDIRHIILRGRLAEGRWTVSDYWFDVSCSPEVPAVALSSLDGFCAELYTIADILRSLSDLTGGQASSCEFALMGQFLEERTRKVEAVHEQLADYISQNSARLQIL